MALIICTECGKEFSDRAPACPQCGCPTTEVLRELAESTKKESGLPASEAIVNSCPNCGEKIVENDYCDNCGFRVKPYHNSRSDREAEITFDDIKQTAPDTPYTICPECGGFNDAGVFKCKSCGHKYSLAEYTVINPCVESESRISCPSCNGHNIQISIEPVFVKEKQVGEVRKKSVSARTANSAGRTMANIATGGMWGLFMPKRSNYSETKKSSAKISHEKYCICQTCGHSWRIS